MKTVIIIPARYGSKRFPGKPLAVLAGKPILQRVWEIAQQVCSMRTNCTAMVATEHPQEENGSVAIIDFCKQQQIPVVLTPESCRSGSDRAWAALKDQTCKPDVVINLQGDNPLCPPAFIHALIDTFENNPQAQVVTPYVKLDWQALDALRNAKKESPFSGTTVTIGKNQRAMWFSKNIIPGIRGESKLREKNDFSPVCRHVGLYAYRFPALAFFSNAPIGEYEALEQLEQLRFIENEIGVHMVEVAYPKGYDVTSGVDSPEDLIRASELIQTHGELVK